MPLVAADLIAPNGPVDGLLYPDTDSNVYSARVTSYLQQAYNDARVAAQTDVALQDNLARAYALARVYEDVYSRMTVTPASINVTEKGGHTYNSEQIKAIQAIVAKYWADFNALLSVIPTATTSLLPGTLNVRTEVEW